MPRPKRVVRRESGEWLASTGALGRAGARPHSPGQLGAYPRNRGEHCNLSDAPVRLGGIVGHDRDARACWIQEPGRIRVLSERGRADDEHDVVRLQRRTQTSPIRGEMPGEPRMIVRESCTRPERLLPDRGFEAVGDEHECLPARGVGGARAHDDRRTL